MNTLRVIKYQPELNKITGSMAATIVMGQLEYWFEKMGGKAFYKFLAPCEDECYKDGDSWCEELAFSKHEFRTAFAAIGKVYKSKKAYTQSKDKFEGKLYLSYYDRIRRRTYYMRNDALLEQVGIDLSIPKKQDPTNPVLQSPITEDYARDLHTQNTAEDDTDKGQGIYQEVINLYHEICEELPKVTKLTSRRKEMIDQLITICEGSITQVRGLFEKVKGSDFLTGRMPKATWKAQFDWIIRPENGMAILSGKYDPWRKTGVETAATPVVEVPSFEREGRESSYPTMPSVRGKNNFTTTYTHGWNMDDLEAMAYDYYESL